MQLNIGDKVRYLNEVGEGTVIKIIDDKTVEITNEHGINVPVAKTELIKIEEKEEKEEKEIKNTVQENKHIYVTHNAYNYAERDQWDYLENKEQEQKNEKQQEENIYIAFVPENDNNPANSDIELYFINNSRYSLLYTISVEDKAEYVNIEAEKIEPHTKSFVSTYKREDISKLTNIQIQVLFYKTTYFTPISPINETIKIRPSKFFKKNVFAENDFFDNYAILIPVFHKTKPETNNLSEEEIRKMIETKKDLLPEPKTHHNISKTTKQDTVEVDLHINKIIDNFKGLTNGEMLNIQLNFFKQNLENAIANKVKRIVFIHGIGNGTLKHELRKILDNEYPDIQYQDASFKEYGYGATMLLLN